MAIVQLIEYIVKALVARPERVTISEMRENEGREKIAIKVDEQDLGKVIGKSGHTIKAIRTIARTLAPHDREIVVDVSAL